MSITNRYFTSLFSSRGGLVDLLDRDHLDVGHDPALGAEVEHLLGLVNPADQRRGDAAPRRRSAWRRVRAMRHA